MTRAKDISKILTDADLSGTLDVTGTVTASGNVGIGTGSPAVTSSTYKNLQLALGGIVSGRTDDTPLYLSSNVSYNSGWKYIANTTASQIALGTNIQFFNAPSGTAGAGATLTERLRIVGSNVLVGTTNQSPAEGTTVGVRIGGNGASQFSAGNQCLDLNRSANNGDVVVFRRSGTVCGEIVVNGDSQTTAYQTSSDYRLKENVTYDFDATTRLKQLKPARFNFISDPNNTTVDGFLAHEVSSIVPEAIGGEKDAVNEDGSIKAQGIDQSKLVPLLVKTIQELEARITALETA